MPYRTNAHVICKLLAVTLPPSTRHTGLYIMGIKYCDTCNEYFSQIDARCFCCNRILKSKPHGKTESAQDYYQDIKPLIKKEKTHSKTLLLAHLSYYDLLNITQVNTLSLHDALRKMHKRITYSIKPRTDYNSVAMYQRRAHAWRTFWYRVELPLQKAKTKHRINQYRRRKYWAANFNGFRAFLRLIESQSNLSKV